MIATERAEVVAVVKTWRLWRQALRNYSRTLRQRDLSESRRLESDLNIAIAELAAAIGHEPDHLSLEGIEP